MKTKTPTTALLLALCLAASGARRAVAESPTVPTIPAVQRAVHEGIAVELTVEPLRAADPKSTTATPREGDTARLRLRIADTSGTPLGSLSLGAWVNRLKPGESAGTDCKQKIESFVSGSWLSRPELDLNTYYVLVLNEDASISVVDPRFGFGSSQLLAMVFLASPGEDWALAAGGERLFVSLPESGAVAAVETRTWKVLANVKTGPHPRRLSLSPDGRTLWAAGDAGVTAIDPRKLQPVAEIATGGGEHDLAWSGDSRYLFVANAAAGTVTVIDADRRIAIGDVPLGPAARPTSIAWSSQARMAYAVDAAGGAVVALAVSGEGEGARPRIAARIPVEPGLGALRFAPGGRFGFLLHPGKNRLFLVDAATQSIVQSTAVEAEPDQVTFSEHLAYVRHRGSDTVLMIPLAEIGKQGHPLPLVDFPGGQNPPGKSPKASPADGIVRTPGEEAVLVANPLDKAIYYYKEGMAAPMGHFQAYGHNPRAVLVLDRSLKEIAPGAYETTAKLPDAGRYEIAVLADNPRLLHCFPLDVAADPARVAAARPLGVQFLTGAAPLPVAEEAAVRFRLTDPASGAPRTGLSDVRVLAFLSPGVWQQRQWASELGDGRYEIRFRPPEAGLYFLFVEVASAGLPLQKSPALTLRAEARQPLPTGGSKP